ncbi:MAG: GlsB/YeaQ/YmgE family stress response membrane protein, partial [Petrimonas sp.]|nr:GlsB/YeaQ/YmgE family stress response membrane protein [Petrimonas sp.]
MRGGGFGLFMNIIVGVVGALIGGWVFDLLGIGTGNGLMGGLITALVGAILLLWLISLFKRA